MDLLGDKQFSVSLEQYLAMSEDEKLRVTRSKIREISQLMFISGIPRLQEIIVNIKDLMIGEKEQFGTVNIYSSSIQRSLDELANLLRIGHDESRKQLIFGPYYNLIREQEPDNLFLFTAIPTSRQLQDLFGDKLTNFILISGIIINTSILLLTSNPKQFLVTVAYQSSLISDCYELQKAISRREVQIGSLRNIYTLMMERALSAGKAALQSITPGQDMFNGLPGELINLFKDVESPENYPHIETLYKDTNWNN